MHLFLNTKTEFTDIWVKLYSAKL